MGQCSAPCVGLISPEDYQQSIDFVLKLLDGKNEEILAEFRQKMNEASDHQQFERAAYFRDRILQVEQLNEEQKINDAEATFDRDVIACARLPDQKSHAVVVILAMRQGKTVGVQQFPFNDIDPDLSNEDFLLEVLAQHYYQTFETAAKTLPKEVLLPIDFVQHFEKQSDLLSRALSKQVDFRIPKRGEVLDLMAMVRKTADFHLSELLSKNLRSTDDLLDVQMKLHLKKFPHRLECFDISHFQGRALSRLEWFSSMESLRKAFTENTILNRWEAKSTISKA